METISYEVAAEYEERAAQGIATPEELDALDQYNDVAMRESYAL
jgi:hypothetical protein